MKLNAKKLPKPADNYIFAENLKILRESRPNLSQRNLALTIGVNRTTYASYESGRRLPPQWFVSIISAYFEVPIDRLVKEKIYYKGASKNEQIKT